MFREILLPPLPEEVPGEVRAVLHDPEPGHVDGAELLDRGVPLIIQHQARHEVMVVTAA